MQKIKHVLISVSNKEGIVNFARGLCQLGIEILSTGGTAKLLQQEGIPVRLVSDYTGFPEMLDGRVKTLHPKIHAALLARRDNKVHQQQCKEHGIELIDMVVVNLYPFQQTISREGIKLEEAIENIDIGGPTMLRSAAKNYESVSVVVNPSRYQEIISELQNNEGVLSLDTKQSLAVEVFKHTSEYDTAIFGYLSRVFSASAAALPAELTFKLSKVQELRYGENPHQMAAFYGGADRKGLAGVKQLHGKELSFNNLLDLDAALRIAVEFFEPAAVIIKHTNPCGVACSETLAKAYADALACDSLSAFGSVVGLNREVDEETAREISAASFVEAVIAPSFSSAAREILEQKKNIRLLELSPWSLSKEWDLKRVAGGLLVQNPDRIEEKTESWRVVTQKKPGDGEWRSLSFAWKIAKHVKSNAIVLVKGTKTVGVGAGQMSRVDAALIAVRKAGDYAKGSVLASDAFFPFRDGVDEAAKAGVVAIIQPGGAKNDDEVIKAADEHGIAMIFTGKRHFRH